AVGLIVQGVRPAETAPPHPVLAATNSYPHLSHSHQILTPTRSHSTGSYSHRLLLRPILTPLVLTPPDSWGGVNLEPSTRYLVIRHSSLTTRHCSGDFRSRQIDSSSRLGQPIAEAGECGRPG